MPLSHLDEKDRATLEQVRRDLHGLFGDGLRAVALTGEAAGASYRPGRSPLELAVLLDQVTADSLRKVRPRLGAWARRRVAAPLILDLRWLADSRDVFPIEFLELRAHHVPLHGDIDPFAGLPVGAEHLRLELEKQLRGKLLHLWEAYLETRGAARRLRALLLAVPQGFAWILRGALHLSAPEQADLPGHGEDERVFAEVERRFGVSIPTLRRLEAARRTGERLPSAELEPIFEALLGELRALVQIGDGA
jgi:hypothetical protein